jgi:hypothetical protein
LKGKAASFLLAAFYAGVIVGGCLQGFSGLFVGRLCGLALKLIIDGLGYYARQFGVREPGDFAPVPPRLIP